MKVGIIGPSNIPGVSAAAGVEAARLEAEASRAGSVIAAAGHEIIVVPDRGVAVIAARSYRAAGGRKIIGLIPGTGYSADGATGRVHLNSVLCDELHRNLTWHEQHSLIVELSDILLCIGMSCGTICEIAWTKWTKRIPVCLIEGLGSRVPPEIESETDIRYVKAIEEALAIGEKTV
jgi:hypothetical protein